MNEYIIYIIHTFSYNNKKRAKVSEDDKEQVGKGEGVHAPQGAVLITPVKHPHLSQHSLQSNQLVFKKLSFLLKRHIWLYMFYINV